MNTKQIALVILVALAVTLALGPAVTGQPNNTTDNETAPGDGQNGSQQTNPSETNTPTPADTPDPTATPTPTPTATPDPTATTTPDSTPTATPTATESPPSDDPYSSTPTPVESDGNDAITDDGEIVECTTIEESGSYYLGGDLQGNPDDACLIVNATVRIEGNGHTLEGPGSGDAVGIRAKSSDASGVSVYDITLTGWGGKAIDHTQNDFYLENAVVTDNGLGYEGGYVGATEFRNVEFTENDDGGMSARPSRDFRAHDVVASSNGGDGLGMWGGGSADVTSSEFKNNGDDGIDAGLGVGAEFSNVEVEGNGDSGVSMYGSMHSVRVSMTDSSVTNNGGAGINAYGGTNENQELTLENTVIQGNEGKTIIAYNPTDTQFGTAVEAQEVTLDGGLSVDFDRQRVTLGTVPVEGATTDALNVTGDDSTAITTEFQVDGETGELWLRTDGDWESHGEYETTNGAFQETVGQGAWMATTVTQESGSSTPSGTPEPQPLNTPDATPTPRSDTPSSPAPGESSPGMPDSEDPTTPPTGQNTSITGTSASSSTPSDGTDGPGTDGSDDSSTEGAEDSSSGDGPGFTGLAAVVALLGTTILVRRRR